ncbi:MAG: hypothetical protein MZU97_11135 [Bacillus subtilis]|nr:hypothetical protein [Bacillus subtilis]
MHPAPLIAVGMTLCNVIGLFKGPKHVSPLIQKMAIDSCPAQMRKDGIIKDRDVEWLTKDVEIQNYYFQSPMCGKPATVAANRDMFKWLHRHQRSQTDRQGRQEHPDLPRLRQERRRLQLRRNRRETRRRPPPARLYRRHAQTLRGRPPRDFERTRQGAGLPGHPLLPRQVEQE